MLSRRLFTCTKYDRWLCKSLSIKTLDQGSRECYIDIEDTPSQNISIILHQPSGFTEVDINILFKYNPTTSESFNQIK